MNLCDVYIEKIIEVRTYDNFYSCKDYTVLQGA